ncbi:MAG: mannitol-/sugar-/sorbitol-6-/2-deoxyglucose-6-phosphatase [Myxococcales bacterium]|nr:mannitol-/sugar-/sorbitol-6-/2-deoxyglucose-6-phosphatase [Myxococcales bacterium]
MRAVIFDMDGLLVDSEPLWVRAEIEIFGEVGVVLGEEDCALTKGLRTDDVIAYWHQRRPWDVRSPAEVEARLVARVAALVRAEGRALPGVAPAIAVAREGGRPRALASSSPVAIIDATLERLGLRGTFDVVQSAATEPLGKPHPGVFLRTAERLDVPAVECLVLEDSLTGVIAAKAARMACIAVPFDHPKHDARFAIADAVIGSLDEVTPALIATLAAKR